MKIRTKAEFDELAAIVARLAALKYFPQQDQAILAIVEDVANLVHSMDRARWLINRMRELYDEWPGPVSLRAAYLDYFPAANEKPSQQLEPRNQLQLPAGVTFPDEAATYGPWPEELLMKPKAVVRKRPVETPLLIPGKDFKPITAEDIEEARRKVAAERASQ